MIVISYDGSPDAQAAIEQAARLMPDATATVLTVWETFVEMIAGVGSVGVGMAMPTVFENSEEIDERSKAAALKTATEGAELASEHGLTAEARVSSKEGGIANTVLITAKELDAELIVMGTRGRGGVKSFLLGSVSHGVVEHASCAVMVVPSEEVAKRRLGA